MVVQISKGIVNRFFALRDAIRIAHAGKYVRLDIQEHDTRATWDSLHDNDWQRYKRARGLLSKHRYLEFLLRRIKAI